MIKREDIIEELKNKGYEVETHTSIKNGMELKGICFMNENGICPIVYTDNIIEESDSLSEAIEMILDTYHNADAMEFDKDKLIDSEFILENLYIGLQKESQEEIVKAETEFEGIEKYLYVRIGDNASSKLTVSLLEIIKIDKEEAWKVAEKNTFAKTKILSMAEMLSMIIGQEIEGADGILMQFVVCNEMDYRGASAILDMESLKEFANKINKNKFFVLPSSVHEMIIVPDDGTVNIEELNTMVTEINHTQVEPEERLTDRAYMIEV